MRQLWCYEMANSSPGNWYILFVTCKVMTAYNIWYFSYINIKYPVLFNACCAEVKDAIHLYIKWHRIFNTNITFSYSHHELDDMSSICSKSDNHPRQSCIGYLIRFTIKERNGFNLFWHCPHHITTFIQAKQRPRNNFTPHFKPFYINIWHKNYPNS